MIPSPAKTVPSSAALRMRRSRERQRQGSMIISLEIGPSVISELVALEWLDVPDRGSKKAISRALTNLIEQAVALRVTPDRKVSASRRYEQPLARLKSSRIRS